MEGTMRNVILCSLTLCLILGTSRRSLAGQDDEEPVYDGRSLSSWIASLGTGFEHELATSALRRIGWASAPALRKAISHDNELVRVRAAGLLWEIAKDKVAVNVVAAGVMSNDSDVQFEAVVTIEKMGPDAEGAIPALLAAFKNPSQQTQWYAQQALLGLGSRSVPILLSAMGHKDEGIRTCAVSTLCCMHDQFETSLPSFVALLDDQSPQMRAVAAKALGSFGTRAALAVPPLRRALKDNDTRGFAANALGRIGPAAYSAVPDLIEMLEDSTNLNSRDGAALALGEIGERAGAAVPALKKALKSEDAELRRRAANALGQIKGEAATTVPALTQALGDKDKVVRCYAAQSLARYGPDAREAVPRLTVMYSDGDADERVAAADALKAIDPDAAATAGIRPWQPSDRRFTLDKAKNLKLQP
jgi:HEAT repeat protein